MRNTWCETFYMVHEDTVKYIVIIATAKRD